MNVSIQQWKCDCCGEWVDERRSCSHGTTERMYDKIGRSMLERRVLESPATPRTMVFIDPSWWDRDDDRDDGPVDDYDDPRQPR